MKNEAKTQTETVHNLSFRSTKPRTQKLEEHKYVNTTERQSREAI